MTSTDMNPWTIFKNFYSTALLVFSIIVVMALIFNGDTMLAHDVHPALAFCVMWFAIIWLNMVEGGQGPLVGLPPVQKSLYKDSHPISHKCTTLAHKGDNLDRYLIGRQFLVLLIVFVTNLSGAPLADSELFGLPDSFLNIFSRSGLAMILMTTMVGQLNSQVNASHCMLDYINTYFMLFTLVVALIIEASGLLHAVYLLQIFFAKLSGKPLISNEPPRDSIQSFLFWFRVFMSCGILAFSFVVTLAALFEGKTTMWKGVPEAISVILFFLLMSIVGMLEGMQIAFFAVTKLPKDEQAQSPIALKTCELLFRGDGRNLPGFMIGRQIGVTMCFFIIAKVTTLDVDIDANDEPVLGVSTGMQAFFNTGLLGAIITTMVASLAWQLVASAFPIAFLSNPLVYLLLRWCLLLEASGICSGAWVLAGLHKRIADFQVDEVYVGTPEERIAKQREEDHDDEAGQPQMPTVPTGKYHSGFVGCEDGADTDLQGDESDAEK